VGATEAQRGRRDAPSLTRPLRCRDFESAVRSRGERALNRGLLEGTAVRGQRLRAWKTHRPEPHPTESISWAQIGSGPGLVEPRSAGPRLEGPLAAGRPLQELRAAEAPRPRGSPREEPHQPQEARSQAPRSLAPRSLAPRSLAPRSLAPRSLAPRSLAPCSLAPLAVKVHAAERRGAASRATEQSSARRERDPNERPTGWCLRREADRTAETTGEAAERTLRPYRWRRPAPLTTLHRAVPSSHRRAARPHAPPPN
jgi:hypothetical protein